ncbi:MAG: homoserine kinase [Bacillota bacterium]
MSWRIKVPATTANLGAGFDSIGVALDLYLFIKVSASDEWAFVSHSKHLHDIPKGKDNFIYKIAQQVADRYDQGDLPACHVELFSDIPLARGLGSSATAIACGIELANLLLDLQLSDHDKVQIATEIEGHPDNVAPAILGGAVVGHYEDIVQYVKVDVSNVSFVAVIPDFELKTKDARAVLPDAFSYSDAVRASSVANVSTAALVKEDWALLGQMMNQDHFHEPHRKALIPHYDAVKTLVGHHAYGVYISGAGPTLMVLVDEAMAKKHLQEWREAMPEHEWLILQPVNQGIDVVDGY